MPYRRLALVIAAGLALPAAAVAQQGGGAVSRVQEACRAELAAHCADPQKSGPPFLCLVANKAKLAPLCASAVAEIEERRQKLRTACQADADKHCQGQGSDGRQLVACLRGKAAELSKGCAGAMAELPGPATRSQ